MASNTKQLRKSAIHRTRRRTEGLTIAHIRELIREELQRLVNFATWIDGEKRGRGKRPRGRTMKTVAISVHPKLWARIQGLTGSASSHVTRALNYYLIMMDLDYWGDDEDEAGGEEGEGGDDGDE